jgi:hypothetical protein
MKHFKPILLIFSFILTNFYQVPGQNVESTKGQAQVRVETNMTKDQCKEQAHELAIINAIENVFGTWAEQQTNIVIKDGRDYYNIVGTTKVKGEWVETTNEEFSETSETYPTKNGKEVVTYITCKIVGKVKKSTPKALIQFLPLNCPDKRCRTNAFYSGESLYLSFRSPVDGFLSVFLEDEEMVYRLFPYSNQIGKDNSATTVKADHEYILFANDPKYNSFQFTADEYELYSVRSFEYNNIYVVFSEEPYQKPVLNNEKIIQDKTGYLLPKSIVPNDFQEWLSYNRAMSHSFLDARISIKIENR